MQLYNVTLDSSTPAWAYGSIQDDGSRRGRIDLSGGRDKIPAVEFVNAPGGEGSHHAIDPADPNIVYSHGFYGNFTRSERRAGGADSSSGAGADPATPQRGRGGRGRGVATSIRPSSPDVELRAQWMAPIIASHARAGSDLRGLPVRLSLGKSR